MTAITSKVCYFIELSVYDTTLNTSRVLYFATHSTQPIAYHTVVDGTGLFDVNQVYDARIKDPGNYEAHLFSSGKTYGDSTTSIGTVSLANTDGALDYTADFGFDGQLIKVWKGEITGTYSEVLTLSPWITGVVDIAEIEYAQADGSTIVLTIRDFKRLLDVPVQTATYLGNNALPNGIEGLASDIKGSVKPLAYGVIFNATPVNVNTSKLVYQVHDGPIDSVQVVYDKGVPLTFDGAVGDLATSTGLLNATVASGKYATCLNEGLIRLGTRPAGGVTVNFKGDSTDGYYSDVANVCKKLMIRAGLGTSVHAASFTALTASAGYPVGVYISADTTYASVIGELLGSIGAFGYFDRLGIYRVGIFSAPATAEYTYETDEILSLTRQASADTEKGIPTYRVKLSYLKNYTVQAADALAGAAFADTAHIAAVSTEYRTYVTEDLSIQTAHTLAKEMTRNSLLANAADAALVGDNMLALYRINRQVYTIQVNSGDNVELNSVVRLIFNRFGMNSGKLFRVLGVIENAANGTQQLILWG